MPESIIEWLRGLSLTSAIGVFFLENLTIFALVILVGNWAVHRFQKRPVGFAPGPVTWGEISIALLNVLINTATTLLGWQLWRTGYIRFRNDIGIFAIADVFALLMIMDLLMYWLHRLAHTRLLFTWIHSLHHHYDRVRPLTLFALSPLENIGFGALWLAVILAYPASWLGISVYLFLNVCCGAIGHLGVEPIPAEWTRNGMVRQIAGSSFHAQHHQDIVYNYGFYTLFWDRLFGTLRPDYAQAYGRLPVGDDSVEVRSSNGMQQKHTA